MANNDVELGIVSFNMHGYHQGSPVIMDIISEDKPDILLLQEHWLTPRICIYSIATFLIILLSAVQLCHDMCRKVC